jgi:outer membrane biosynthesis protein TonB
VRTATLIRLALPVALLAACGRDARRSATGTDDDLQRDLKLASTSRMDLAEPHATLPATVSDFETPPAASPAPATRIVRKPGPKAVRAKHPTVAAAPESRPAESTEAPTVAEAPTAAPQPTTREEPSPSTDGVPMPRPTSAPATDPGAGNGRGTGTGASDGQGSGGWGGVIGGIIGAVIRGGGVGDDHCDPRTDGRRPPIYHPGGGVGSGRYPGGGYPRGGGGWGIPVNPARAH